MNIAIKPFIILCILINQLEAQYSINSDSVTSSSKINKSDLLIPSILFGASMICYTHNTILDNLEFKKVRNKWLSDFRIHADDYLQFAPIAMVFASDILGVEGKNKFWDQCFILLKAQILTELFIQPLKYVTHVLRPDNSGYNSFPSGHTAEAFMAATFLHKEFGDRSIFYSLAGYSIASTVGLLRIANNRHWASDVFAGAAFGILATNLAYKIVPLKPSHKFTNRLIFQPSYANNKFIMNIKLCF